MKKIFAMLLVCAAVLTFTSCDKEGNVADSAEAIEISKTIEMTQGKVDYLMKQADYMYKSGDFQEVVNVTQYILTHIDSNSEEASKLLDKAKAEILKKVEEGLEKVSTDYFN